MCILKLSKKKETVFKLTACFLPIATVIYLLLEKLPELIMSVVWRQWIVIRLNFILENYVLQQELNKKSKKKNLIYIDAFAHRWKFVHIRRCKCFNAL